MSRYREAVLGEVMQDRGVGETQPDYGWFILGVDGYFDVDNACWCEFQEDDAPWTAEFFDLHGVVPDIIARLKSTSDTAPAEPCECGHDMARHRVEFGCTVKGCDCDSRPTPPAESVCGHPSGEVMFGSDHAFTICKCGRGIVRHVRGDEWWHSNASIRVDHVATPSVTPTAGGES